MDESLPYRVSYSNGVEKCGKCRHRIQKDDVQIAIMVQSNEDDCKYPMWYHRECFFKVRLPPTEAVFDGFAELRYQHQMAIRTDLGIEIKSDGLENQIRQQSEQYFEIYDFIAKYVTYAQRVAILNRNSVTVSANAQSTRTIHQLADMIYFGVLENCPKCRKGELVFSNWTYKCSNAKEWSTCGMEVKEPKRRLATTPTDIPASLEQHKGVRTRLFYPMRFFDEKGNDIVYGPYKRPPLFNMELVLVGDFTKPKADIELLIRKMGGKVGTKIHDRVAAVISTVDEVQKMGKQMTDARMYDIQVVSEDFLIDTQCPDVDPIGYILSESICDWGGDPYDRIAENDVASRIEGVYEESMPQKITYNWKGGSAVDPECGLGDNVQVYSAKMNGTNVYYSVILGFVDIHCNKNSYYRMQMLESNVKGASNYNCFWLYESWGRTGTVIGSKKTNVHRSLQGVLQQFVTVYESKTGNTFGSQPFQKKPNKFFHHDVEVEIPKKSVKTRFDETNLEKPVYDLMQMLFDIEKVEGTMVGCDLDLKEMPLGKISTQQMKMAMSTLKSIEKLIRKNATKQEFLDASNQFYTLIPHAYGISRPPIINSMEMVRAKSQMLESLLDMEIIHDFLDSENDEAIHPLDLCYCKLQTTIVPVPKNSDKYRRLCDIVRDTQNPPTILEVLDIFSVVRDAEVDHNNCHINWKLRNHQLLWHGSRVLNFATILSKGLKISPPEALSTGKRFGNGIYFADAVSKSAPYCFGNGSDVILMLLCEVALGISKSPTESISAVLPNEENQSIHATGQYVPTKYTEIDGVRIASEIELPTHKSSSYSDYNEFIIFDPNQVKIRYLFKMQYKKR